MQMLKAKDIPHKRLGTFFESSCVYLNFAEKNVNGIEQILGRQLPGFSPGCWQPRAGHGNPNPMVSILANAMCNTHANQSSQGSAISQKM